MGRAGAGDGVRHLVRRRVGDVARRERYSEGARRHLAHLCVQALPHLAATHLAATPILHRWRPESPPRSSAFGAVARRLSAQLLSRTDFRARGFIML